MNESANQALGYINSIETFGAVDGPGIRYIIFMQGCAMRCLFCHNPHTWEINKNNGKTAQEVLDKACEYQTYWGEKGGITVSGGEPLLQIDFLIELFTLAKERGINTTLDTCGQPFRRTPAFLDKFSALMRVCDLVLLDIKEINEETHTTLTGHSNKNILDCARYLDEINHPVWIRHVLVPGYSDNDDDLDQLNQFIKSLKNVERVEVLPYHAFGALKYAEMNIPYPLADTPVPNSDRVANANKRLETDKYKKYMK